MENVFDDIIERDEHIIEIIKPNKKRYWKNPKFFIAIPFFWPHIIILTILSLFTFPIIYLISYKKAYNNLYYAYTNKRLIVRSGIFGIDYKSLEYKDITSTSVDVGFLDKKCKTGSLQFINPSSHHTPINFAYVENPYELMKDIKEQISNAENK